MSNEAPPLIDVTGHRQREAWANKVLPPVEEVRPGLWSIPVPMGDNPLRYILVYALATTDGLALIDAGWCAEDSWQALLAGIRATGHDLSDVTYVAITHLHPDHFGLVPRLLETVDPVLAMHRYDASFLRHHEPAEVQTEFDEIRDHFRRLGAPPEVSDTERFDLTRLPRGRTIDVELDDGDPLGLPGWDVSAVWTPGHTGGHLCFVDTAADVAFTGDHLLPRISPNISAVNGEGNPLGLYLTSLANTGRIGGAEALPAHEYRFRGIEDRAAALLDHHEHRLTEIDDAVSDSPGLTTWDVTTRITWSRPFDDMVDGLRRMALRETHAHLILLAERGRIRRSVDNPESWVPVPQP